MTKKNKSLTVRGEIEILNPVQPAAPNLNAALERMVERKLAEMMGDSQNGIFEPFFQARAIMHAIKKIRNHPTTAQMALLLRGVGLSHLRKQEAETSSLGMCGSCHQRTAMRLQRILRRASDDKPEQAPARDLQDVARAALNGRRQ